MLYQEEFYQYYVDQAEIYMSDSNISVSHKQNFHRITSDL